MKATQILRDEHKQIKRMLAILNHVADKVEAGEEIPVSLLEDAVRFVRDYADKTHHGKEEVQLFPLLVKHGMPEEAGPIGQMLTEHVSGREFVGQLSEGIDAHKQGKQGASKKIVEAIRGYTGLLSRHIQKEDMILFTMADQMLSPEADEALFEKFCQVDRELITEEELTKWKNLLDEYESKFNLPKIADEDLTPGCLAFAGDPDKAVEDIVKDFKKK